MIQDKIKKPYLLYVGNAYPHKNLERLFFAFKIVLQKRLNIYLILVGKIDYFYEKAKKIVEKLKIQKKVIFLGQINDSDLVLLYKNGLAYIFPSLKEGFGLPGLEAMRYGLPVISSNRQPLPEIYNKSAYYFNPESINEMAKAILKVINEPLLREKMRKEGYQQSKKYSWKECAQKTLKIYNSIK